MKHIISLGAGVQSSALALLAARGDVGPMPECAVFADTGFEPQAVYDWLDWLEAQLPFPVHRVSAGNIEADGTKGAHERVPALPFFTGNNGMVTRQCTAEYKIAPVEKFQRRVMGLKPRQRGPKTPQITLWMGISADEAQRMKPAKHKWHVHRFPLAMELGWRRSDCILFVEREYGRTPPRSSCLACPYHSDSEWKELKENAESWARIVAFDKTIRRRKGLTHDAYLHKSLKPIDEVDFSKGGQVDLFGEECEGMCGL